jgi:hypothetical protein
VLVQALLFSRLCNLRQESRCTSMCHWSEERISDAQTMSAGPHGPGNINAHAVAAQRPSISISHTEEVISCPCSNSYAPTITNLYDVCEMPSRHVLFGAHFQCHWHLESPILSTVSTMC